ncbi:MAG: ABC transporter ATP-binding protein [Candidatus Binatia bacterium]
MKIRMKGLTKRFDRVTAVDHLTLDIENRELFFLLGPSGCGKTTALRLVAGFYKPDDGELYFNDRLMNKVPPQQRNTGMVFQNYALWPHMDVYKNVEYGLEIRKIEKRKREEMVRRALAVVKMEEYIDRYPNQLSGGQQQRVALARALVIEPDVLLLDEPLSNLDAKLRLEMRDEIKRIHEETKITTIYVTHDQKEALSMADRMAVMDCGKIIQVGSTREVYRSPKNRFIADFIGETNLLRGRVTEINRGKGFVIIETPYGPVHSIHLPDGLRTGTEVYCSIRPESLSLAHPHEDHFPNRLKAVIEGVTYLGEIEQYRLAIGENLELKMMLNNPEGHERKRGEIVEITFHPKDVVVFFE